MSEQIEQQNNKPLVDAEQGAATEAKLDAEQGAAQETEPMAGFQVINEGFSTLEAIEEAKRCLHCKIPQCRKGCPIENDIPDFVHELSMGNMGGDVHHQCQEQLACHLRTSLSSRETVPGTLRARQEG